jgi:hypothetical protein
MAGSMPVKMWGGTWGLPLVGLAGTIAAILIGFARIGNEPQWKTVLVSAGSGVLIVGIALVLLTIATRIRR